MENDELIEEQLEIRETVDGVATIDGEGARSRERRATSSTSKEEDIKAARTAEAAKTAALAKKKNRPDPYIWGIYIAFLVISVIELFSASSTEVSGQNVYSPLIRHAIFLFLGFGIVLWLQRTPYTLLNKFAWAFGILSLGLILLSNFVGINVNNAQRALSIAGITIQPAEIAKLSVVILLASIFGKNQTPGGVTNIGLITATTVVILFSAFLIKNGFTNTMLLVLVSLCMMMIGGVPWKKFFLVVGIYLVAGGAMGYVKYMTPKSTEFEAVQEKHELISQSGGGAVTVQEEGKVDRTETRKNRIVKFLLGVHPEDPIDDDNRQVVFSKFSQANGGLFGQGPGNSRESARLPLAFSDYIYSIVVEDTGFVGGAAVLLLYLLLLARAGRIAYYCSRAFPAFLIMGCAVMIVFQALVHMAIVTGVVPVSGQPLPFISKGGTSVLVMSAALGIMLSVARFAAHSGDTKQIKAEKEALPEDMQAANISGK